MTNYYGIDLGTTYSAIACVSDDGTVEVIKVDGEYLTPSVVYFRSPNEAIVGHDAVVNVPAKDAHCVAGAEHIKRLMHKEDSASFFKYNGQEKDPVTLSVMILKKLLNGARDEGHNVQEVTITHPAYFDQLAIKRTKDAGVEAGIEKSRVHLVPEPIAAAVYYAEKHLQEAKGKNVLVYDLGGGTFDVTVVKISQQGNVEHVSLAGDHQLGGKDWDKSIVKFLAGKLGFESTENKWDAWDKAFEDFCATQAGSDARDKVNTFYIEAEKIKRRLTAVNSHEFRLVLGTFFDAQVTITRQDFSTMTLGLLEQTYSHVEKALNDAAQKGINNIDTCLLVGGSTFMPQVKEGLQQRFGTKLGTFRQLDPNEAVARGAAYYAKAPEKTTKGLSRSYGVSLWDVAQDKEYIKNFLFVNDPIPVENASNNISPINPTDCLRVAIYESKSTEQELYDVDRHKLLVEKEWHLGRTVQPSEMITYVVKFSRDGILELWGRLEGVPDIRISIQLGGETSARSQEQRVKDLRQISVR